MNPETSAELQSVWAQVHSDTGMPFPKTVEALLNLGVNRYRVDFIASSVTAYVGNQADVQDIPKHGDQASAKAGSASWNISNLQQAIRNAQSGKGNYFDFSSAAIAAGVTDYTVYFAGQRVIYAGADGYTHTEWFPGAKKD